MKQTNCTICYNTAERVEDILQLINYRNVSVEMVICQLHSSEDVQAFINRSIFFANLNNATFRVTKLDVTQMENPDPTIDLVKNQFGHTLRQIILKIAGRKVNQHI